MNITKEDMEALRNAQPSWFKNGGLAANVDLNKPSFLAREQPHRTLTKRAEMELEDKEQNFQQRSHPMPKLLACPTSDTLTIALSDIMPCPELDTFDLNGTYSLTWDGSSWSIHNAGSYHHTSFGDGTFFIRVLCLDGILTAQVSSEAGGDAFFFSFRGSGRLTTNIANIITDCSDTLEGLPVESTGGTAVITLP